MSLDCLCQTLFLMKCRIFLVRNSLLFLNLSSNSYYLSAVFIATPRDRLEDMRFLYDTAAETNSKISFDSADPFYDSLPWFRLIGRYFSSSF